MEIPDCVKSQWISSVSLGELFGPQFEYESDPNQRCPQWEYYWFRKRQLVLKLIERHKTRLRAAGDGPLRWADLGCNDGLDLFLVRKNIFSNWKQTTFVGLDTSPRGLELFRFRKEYFRGDNVAVVHGDLTKPLPFKDHEVDFVYCSEVLEHLKEPEALIREMQRVLRRGGLLLITTPNEPNIFQRSFWIPKRRERQSQALLNKAAVLGEVNVYGHISLKRFGEWRRLIESNGFKEIDFERGALAYSFGPRTEFVWAIQFLIEGLLDLLPRNLVRGLSDQVIALYTRT